MASTYGGGGGAGAEPGMPAVQPKGVTYLPLSFGGKTKPVTVSFTYKDRPEATGAC